MAEYKYKTSINMNLAGKRKGYFKRQIDKLIKEKKERDNEGIKLTKEQINKKYKDKYIDVYECPFWDTNEKGEQLFEVRKVYSEIHENTARGEDIGTKLAYRK